MLQLHNSQDWEIRTEPVPFSEGGSCLISMPTFPLLSRITIVPWLHVLYVRLKHRRTR
jgi:hypothetical protein